ncbi:MAG: hypothetical protein B7Y16_02145 [Methylotenera sp. 24-45-7]|jgi:hypothetical protein|nr:MAG: hypothetical protein B7Y16_02145 [Methylotenera sp. 24-45-7]OZA08760.1 MAG: hypothetical protein B7X97_05200 [Methylotenera sp. 17-45-7]OZA54109.1 MAG: hypothetical protein B7X73_02080 [Methylophilales bacterium 39-45-7]HQS36727.1 hypothetical protein [Methylotenera sp.]HQS42806.1 hypothetical protein [Methylotenera sp.]
MQTTYSQRLKLMHALSMAASLRDDETPITNLDEFDALNAADYLSCYVTFKAIQAAERSPLEERSDNFDMLSVYQAFALLSYAFFTTPLAREDIQPEFSTAQITIAKTLFAGLPDAELIEIIEAGFNKFKLIADAQTEHWQEFRENLDKVVVAFVIAGTDDESPHGVEEILPIYGQLLSQLCEAFESA